VSTPQGEDAMGAMEVGEVEVTELGAEHRGLQ
jgi:hypothetical protein